MTLRKVNVKSYGFDKLYMDKDVTDDRPNNASIQ